MSFELDNLVNLLATLADPKKFSAQLAELRAAMDGAKAVEKAKQDLEIAKHEAAEEIRTERAKHDAWTKDADAVHAKRVNELEAREKRVAQLEASAAEHEAKAKAIHKAAQEKWARFTA